MLKTCSKCHKELPATTEYFHRHPQKTGGLHPRCKNCRSEDRHLEHEKNREKERAQMQEYYKKHSKEIISRVSIWKKNNPRDHTEYTHNYGQLHKEEHGIRSKNRRAKIAGAVGKHTTADVLRLYEEQNGKCAYYGVDLGQKYHVDHIVPISRGGSNSSDNLAIACPHCNLSKWAKLPEEWKPIN